MPGVFHCPHCGAQNPTTGEEHTVRCAYCGSEVTVPLEIADQAATRRLSAKARTWLILFIVFVFVVPTCVGIGGGLLGTLAAVFASIVAAFASFLGH